MTDAAVFFRDLAVMMAVTGATAAVFSKLGWPKVLGFIAAGVLMSGHTWGGPLLVDEKSVQTIGQLGIVFLMFSLGLEFSIASMRRVGHVAVPTAFIDAGLMVWFGYLAGTRIFGWGRVQALFLGVAICDSATTLLSKTIEEMNWSGRPFTRYIFGTTIMEDIICVGLLAAATGVAGGGGDGLSGAGMAFGRLALFLAGVIVIGMARMPRTLDKLRRSGRETVMLATLGFCFLVSYIADLLEIGVALGAFVSGVICASSSVRDELQAMVDSLRTMFAAVFFVAIGLLVNPAVCADNWLAILSVTLLVLVGKFLNVTVASLLTGQSVKNSVQTGMGLAQIGEFAYMAAMIYISMSGRADDPMYQIVVGASLATTVLNPVLLKLSDPVGDWCERNQPAKFRKMMANYSGWLERFRTARPPSRQKLFLRVYAGAMLLAWTVLFIGYAVCGYVAKSDFSRFGAPVEANKRLILCLAANTAALLPLIYVAATARKLGRLAGALVAGTWSGKGAWRRASQGVVRTFVQGAAVFATLFLMAISNLSVLPEETWARISVFAVIAVYGFFHWKRLRRRGAVSARRFRAAIAAEDRRAAKKAADAAAAPVPPFSGVRQRKFAIPAGSPFAGETIGAADIRRRTGATIICLERGGEAHWNPGPGWMLAAGDILSVIADADNFSRLEAIASASSAEK